MINGMAIRSVNGLALCAGQGGLELGLSIAVPSYRTICYVEGEAYSAASLVAAMDQQRLHEAPVWSDVKSFDGKPWRGKVDILSGGYPCQPFSMCGHRKGESDPRHLWPGISGIIKACQPKQCFFENVPGHLSLGFETVANDLQSMGYTVAAGLFTAKEIGANHTRQRLFILAHSHGSRPEMRRFDDEGRYVSDCSQKGILDWWEDSSKFIRVGDGVACWVDRLRGSGNGVVPLQAAYAYHVLGLALED